MNIFFLSLLLSLGLHAQTSIERLRAPDESITQLNRIAADPNTRDITSFLRALPMGSFQTFTFISNSRSLQRGSGEGMVSDLWPRVLRTSTDGKITMSYVCNPKSGMLGRIEVLFFDDPSQTFKTMTYDLAHHTQILNQNVCMSCHSLSMKPETLQPIWPENGSWRDCDDQRGISFYGGSQDTIGNLNPRDRRDFVSSKKKIPYGCTLEKDQEMIQKEAEAYRKFREVQKDNPCYALLPWPEDLSQFPSYPYHDRLPQPGLSSPNLEITINYSKLTARRNVRVLELDRGFKKIEPYILLEGLGCLESRDFAALDPRIVKDEKRSILSQFAGIAGLRNRDWNLVQNASEPGFRTGTKSLEDLVVELMLEKRKPEERSCEKIRRRL